MCYDVSLFGQIIFATQVLFFCPMANRTTEHIEFHNCVSVTHAITSAAPLLYEGPVESRAMIITSYDSYFYDFSHDADSANRLKFEYINV